jgi:hypothetical protein
MVLIVEEGLAAAGGDGLVGIAGDGVGNGGSGRGLGIVFAMTPWVVLGKVGGKVSHERVQGLGPEELEGILPLLRADEFGVCDDLQRGRLETVVQLAEALFLAVGQQLVELIGGGRGVWDFVNVMMKSLGVLDGRRESVVFIVQIGEELVPLHAKLPSGPWPPWVVHSIIGLGGIVSGYPSKLNAGNRNQRESRNQETNIRIGSVVLGVQGACSGCGCGGGGSGNGSSAVVVHNRGASLLGPEEHKAMDAI